MYKVIFDLTSLSLSQPTVKMDCEDALVKSIIVLAQDPNLVPSTRIEQLTNHS